MQKTPFYLMYNKNTFALVKEVLSWTKEINQTLRQSAHLACINTTHPTNQIIIDKINEANGTRYREYERCRNVLLEECKAIDCFGYFGVLYEGKPAVAVKNYMDEVKDKATMPFSEWLAANHIKI